MKPPSSVRTAARSFPTKLLTSAPSAEQSSTKTSRRLLTRNLHNRPMKKNRPVDEGGQKDLLVDLKVLPAGQAGHPGGLADLLVLLVGLLVLPVDLAGHLEGAEHDGPGKAWSELGKVWIEPRKAQRQPKSEHGKQNGEHRKDKGVVGDAVIHECREGVSSRKSV